MKNWQFQLTLSDVRCATKNTVCNLPSREKGTSRLAWAACWSSPSLWAVAAALRYSAWEGSLRLEVGLECSPARYWVGDSGCGGGAPASPGLGPRPSNAAVLAIAGSPRGDEVGILKWEWKLEFLLIVKIFCLTLSCVLRILLWAHFPDCRDWRVQGSALARL